MFKLMGKKIITILRLSFLLNWTNAFHKRNRAQETELGAELYLI